MRIFAFGSEMIEVSGLRTSAPTRHHVQALVARAQHLGLVGDRQVHAAGRHLLDRRGRVGRLADLHVEPGLLEVPARLRRVDAGVVGVGEVVEHQLSCFEPDGSSASSFSPQPASRATSASSRGDDAGHAVSSFRFQGQARRSASVASANSADGHQGEDHDPGVHARGLELVVAEQDEPAEALVGAGPLAEHGADHRHGRGDLAGR